MYFMALLVGFTQIHNVFIDFIQVKHTVVRNYINIPVYMSLSAFVTVALSAIDTLSKYLFSFKFTELISAFINLTFHS